MYFPEVKDRTLEEIDEMVRFKRSKAPGHTEMLIFVCFSSRRVCLLGSFAVMSAPSPIVLYTNGGLKLNCHPRAAKHGYCRPTEDARLR